MSYPADFVEESQQILSLLKGRLVYSIDNRSLSCPTSGAEISSLLDWIARCRSIEKVDSLEKAIRFEKEVASLCKHLISKGDDFEGGKGWVRADPFQKVQMFWSRMGVVSGYSDSIPIPHSGAVLHRVNYRNILLFYITPFAEEVRAAELEEERKEAEEVERKVVERIEAAVAAARAEERSAAEKELADALAAERMKAERVLAEAVEEVRVSGKKAVEEVRAEAEKALADARAEADAALAEQEKKIVSYYQDEIAEAVGEALQEAEVQHKERCRLAIEEALAKARLEAEAAEELKVVDSDDETDSIADGEDAEEEEEEEALAGEAVLAEADGAGEADEQPEPEAAAEVAPEASA